VSPAIRPVAASAIPARHLPCAPPWIAFLVATLGVVTRSPHSREDFAEAARCRSSSSSRRGGRRTPGRASPGADSRGDTTGHGIIILAVTIGTSSSVPVSLGRGKHGTDRRDSCRERRRVRFDRQSDPTDSRTPPAVGARHPRRLRAGRVPAWECSRWAYFRPRGSGRGDGDSGRVLPGGCGDQSCQLRCHASIHMSHAAGDGTTPGAPNGPAVGRDRGPMKSCIQRCQKSSQNSATWFGVGNGQGGGAGALAWDPGGSGHIIRIQASQVFGPGCGQGLSIVSGHVHLLGARCQ
jgi:hypothetical protein